MDDPVGALIVRVACATHRSPADVARDAFLRTVWTFEHMQQHEYFRALTDRGKSLNQASLTSLAFHEPKKIGEEQRKLMASIGMVKVASLDESRALLEDMRKIDAAGGWQ